MRAKQIKPEIKTTEKTPKEIKGILALIRDIIREEEPTVVEILKEKEEPKLNQGLFRKKVKKETILDRVIRKIMV